jgi:hypothetical protein
MPGTEMEELSPPQREEIGSPQGEEIDSPRAGGTPNGPPPGSPSAVPPARRFWTAALAAALLVTAGGLGLLYVDDTHFQNAAGSLTSQNESLTGRNQNLSDQLNTTKATLTATMGELATTKTALEHPHVTIWNVPQTIKGSTYYLAGGIPDTFTYHLEATSTGPMSISILTVQDWAKAIECVDYGRGPTNYCMHHSGGYKSWFNVTSISYDFHLSEGCAAYMAVFTSAGTIKVTPNVSVTYNPASAPTGSCAS